MIKRHTRKSQQHPQGAIVEREGTIHISNVRKSGTRRPGGGEIKISHGQIRDVEK